MLRSFFSNLVNQRSGPIETAQQAVIDQQWPEGLPVAGATSFTAAGGPNKAWSLNGTSDELTFDVGYGLTLVGHVFYPLEFPPEGATVRDGWVIYSNGHEDYNAAYDRVKYFVDRGFKTVCLFMPNFEPNETSWTYQGTGGNLTIEYTSVEHPMGHEPFEIVETQGRNIMPLFIDQVFRAANWIRSQGGTNIHLSGHSGGGWMTSACAALDDRRYFNVKYSSAGEIPFSIGEVVHVEQAEDRPYWLGKDWPDWYAMAARYGRFVKTHNENDSCCFAGAGREAAFAQIVADVNAVTANYPGTFDIVIDDQDIHTFSTEMKQLFMDDCISVDDADEYEIPSGFANWALAANGGVASASGNAGAGYLPNAANNGIRHSNLGWGFGGAWGSTGGDQWLQIDFAAPKAVTLVNVFTLADAVNYNTEPTLSDTFTAFGILDFKVQTWNGSEWVDQATVTSNNKVWRQFTFAAVTTSKVRVLVSSYPDFARIVELEAWGN